MSLQYRHLFLTENKFKEHLSSLIFYRLSFPPTVHYEDSPDPRDTVSLKVHKIENFCGFDFEICTFS